MARLLPDKRLTFPWTRWLLSAAVMAAAFALYFPYPPGPVTPGLDSSWMIGLSMAHARSLVFGQDVVFTYGPLGYLLAPVFPETGSAEYLLFTFFLFGTWLWAVFRMATAAESRARATAVCLAAVLLSVLLMAMSPSASNTARLESAVAVLALSAVLRLPDPAWPEWMLLAVWAGVALLCKLNSGVEAFLLLAAVVWPTRIPLAMKASVPALAGLTTAVLYGQTSHGWAGLYSYLILSYQIAAGYSEAMVLDGPAWQFWLAVAGVAVVLVVAPLLARDRKVLMWGCLSAGVAAFFAFKHAMVRQDEHALPYFVELGLASCFLLAATRTTRGFHVLMGVPALCLGAWIGVVQAVSPGIWERLKPVLTASPLPGNVRAHWHFETTREQLARQTRELLAPRAGAPDEQQALAGRRADMIPVDIDVVRASGWNWTPRPVFQSYSVYTPGLDAVNSAHLSSSGAAERIVYRRSQVDYRHELVEDPRSWQTLFSWYDVLLLSGGDLVLQRRSAPRYGAAVDKDWQIATWGRGFSVPPSGDGLLLLHASAKRSLYGALRTFFYRLEPMYIDVTRRSGAKFSSRVVRANLEEGVPISFWPQSPPEWIRAFGGHQDDPVTEVRFRNESPWEYDSLIEVRWSVLPQR